MNAILKMPSIQSLNIRLPVEHLVRQLDAAPELWNQHTLRTDRYQTPHDAVSDIWVRFNAWDKFDGDAFNFIMKPHESVWYPCIAKIPAAWSIARKVYRLVGGRRMGGILITKIPAGGQVKPHVDGGWHAEHYEKFAVQVKGSSRQSFCFEDDELSPMPGDLYTFDNSRLHWVRNDSDEDRITLIICIRRTP